MTELRREQGVHTGKYREHAQKHMQTPRKMTLKLKNIEKHTEDQKVKENHGKQIKPHTKAF